MQILQRIKSFFKKYILNDKWRCLNCGKEIFNDARFCDECYKILPFNDHAICDHCGREVLAFTNYCLTCKERLLSIDKGRSVFTYAKPISTMIKKLKYGNHRYIAEYFIEVLSFTYLKNYFNADLITYVPMTEKALRRRGYNQSQILAKGVSERVNVKLFEGIVKIKDTERQATLKKDERLKNLIGAFKINEKREIKGKVVVIIDDVTTTGATAEAIASCLKKAGAKIVYLITVASLPSKDKY